MHEKRLIKAVYCPKSCCVSLIETKELNSIRKWNSINIIMLYWNQTYICARDSIKLSMFIVSITAIVVRHRCETSQQKWIVLTFLVDCSFYHDLKLNCYMDYWKRYIRICRKITTTYFMGDIFSDFSQKVKFNSIANVSWQQHKLFVIVPEND